MKVDGLLGQIVFGPVDSRRYGRSLGVNPLPADIKLCNFNCPYCECGWTDVKASRRPKAEWFPSVEEVEAALRAALESIGRAGPPIDNITVAGNGEPTLHPRFPALVECLLALRKELAPAAGLVILSNSTGLDRPEIVRALSRLDEQIMKLDAGSLSLFQRLALPVQPFSLDAICEGIKQLPHVVIQSMFVDGRLNNTREPEISLWIDRLREIRPRRVQVYSLDRPAPDPRLRRVEPVVLNAIARRVERELGVAAEVFF